MRLSLREHISNQVHYTRNAGYATPYDEHTFAEDVLTYFIENCDEIELTSDEYDRLENALATAVVDIVDDEIALWEAGL